jgi:hypothetical protein
MGDGAPRIWNLSAPHFPGAAEVVDLYHAVERLRETAEALRGNRDTSRARRAWVRHYRRKLKKGRFDLVLKAIERSS